MLECNKKIYLTQKIIDVIIRIYYFCGAMNLTYIEPVNKQPIDSRVMSLISPISYIHRNWMIWAFLFTGGRISHA